MLEISDVVVRFRRQQVLAGFSLTLGRGETMAIIGPRGFGGTTLIKIIAGTLTPAAGRVLLDGADIHRLPPQDRPIGLVPAGGALLPHLTVKENILYGFRLRGDPRAFYAERLDKLVHALQLEPSLNLFSPELSPGLRMRVGLARAAARVPRVLAVDATAGADGMSGLWHLARHARLDASMSIVACTSDPRLLDADRVALVRDGRVVRCGPPARVRSAPPDLAAARLVHPHPLPVVSGTVAGTRIECRGYVLPAPPGAPAGRRVEVALPAEALVLDPAGELPGRLVAPDTAGEAGRACVTLDGAPGTCWPVRLGQADAARTGGQVRVRVLADRLLLFDAEVDAHPLIVCRRGQGDGGDGQTD